jgi:putative CocE/NonD family hydrolase
MQPQPPIGVHVDFNVPATMRDGTVLRANVYRPDDGGAATYPVLLTRLPYGKDLPSGSSVLDPAQAARRGYIVAVQDVRGTFASEGAFAPFQNEADDGADTVAWAAMLPGANGSVAMYGASYFGYTQWAAASRHPAALRAIAPMITFGDPDSPAFGVLSRSGVIELGTQGDWNLEMGLDQIARRYRGEPQQLAKALYALVKEIDALPTAGYRELPLVGFGPLARHGLDEPVTVGIERRHDEAFLERSRVSRAYAFDLPALHIGGWYDPFLNATLQNFANMRARGHANQRLLIGPWTHGNVNRVQGDLDFGFASSGALMDLQVDLMTFQLQFFDRWLKGVQNGLDAAPAVKYFVMGANIWKTSETWPPDGAYEEAWYLHSQGAANSSRGEGWLSRARPEGESADSYVYHPASPVPTVGGATLLPSTYRPGPRDQRAVEERQDVLVYTSEPLAAPLEVTGPVGAVLYVATDAPDTDFVARLVDVYPDGMAITVTDGITRMRYRNGTDEDSPPLRPGEVCRIQIDLWATSLVFPPGHRIRVDVTSSSFPRWERNLNTGADNATTTEMRAARQTVLHDEAHPSHLVLSVVSG